MFGNNLTKFHKKTCYLKTGRIFNLVFLRSKSKFQGKKQQNLEKIIYEDKNVPNPETTDFEPDEFKPRRLTYMPEGLPQNRGKKIKWWLKDRTPVSLNVNPIEREEEWVDKPQYPPIVEMSTGFMRNISEQRELRREFYRSIERLPTYDQKQFELTNLKPIPTTMFNSVSKFYDYLPLYKYLTRTHVVENELPSAYNLDNEAKLNELVQKIKPHILNSIKNSLEFEIGDQKFEVGMHLRKHRNISRLKKDEALIQNINSICMKQLADTGHEHLHNSIVEFNSDVRSWWWAGKFPVNKNLKIFQIYNVNKVNLSCQYEDYAPLNIRTNEPLQPILDQKNVLVYQDIPVFPTNPFKLGFRERFYYVSNFPGFLPSLNDNETIKTAERGDFPFITYLNRELVNIRNEMNLDNFNDTDDVIQAMAILHNFSYLNALAGVHGFTTYSELTYPFTNQTIITNGQYWSFFVYQMNTHSFHSDLPESKKRNICWSVNNLKLYESFNDGKFEGVNDEVIKNLIKMYLQKPKLTAEYSELRPYLDIDERDDESKEKLRSDLKRRFAQYKTQREKIAMLSRITYKWEWVYKRNPESSKKFLRTIKKRRDPWPVDKVQLIAHDFNHKEL